MALKPDFPGRAVVAHEELAVAHDASAESRAERDAEEIAKAPGAPRYREQPVDLGKEPMKRLAVGEEVAVIVDEDRHTELVFQHRSQRDPAPKGGKVAEIADHSRRVIRRTGKSEGERRHRAARFVPNAGKALDDLRQARGKVVCSGGQRHAGGDLAIAGDCREAKARPPGIERQDDAGLGLPRLPAAHDAGALRPKKARAVR